MKKVVNVTIGKVVFILEEDAHKRLEKYLNSVEKHFGKKDETTEILEDIEISFAEKFLEMRKNKDMAITLEQVDLAIEEMGTVKELSDDDFEEEEDEGKSVHKLYRDPDDVIVGGVASGIAAYFGIDTVIVRLLFFLSIFAGGFGFFLYIILWIIVPEAQTTSQKYEMRGEKLTLERIEESLKKGREKIKKKDLSGISGFLNKFFRLIGGVLRFCFNFLRVFIGILLCFAMILAIGVLVFAFTMLVLGQNVFDLYLPEPFSVVYSFYEMWHVYLFAATIFILFLIPFIFIFKIGLSLLRKKNTFRAGGVLGSVILWFAALAIGIVLVLNSIPDWEKFIGEGMEMIDYNDSYQVEEFNELYLAGDFDFKIERGNGYFLRIEGNGFGTEELSFENEGESLYVDLNEGFCWWCDFTEFEITLVTPNGLNDLEMIRLDRSVDFDLENEKIDEFEIYLNGASELVGENLEFGVLKLEVSGASFVQFENGNADYLDLEVSGASEFVGDKFVVNEMKLKASGATEILANVEKILTGEISGASELEYWAGENLEVKIERNGGAEIEKLN